jgi:hypothetical protein
MNTLALLAIFAATVYVTAFYSIARAFVFVYVPALLILYLVPQQSLPGIPNLTTPSAVGYAVLMMAPFKWREVQRIRLNGLDLMVLLMFVPPVISVMLNNTLWDGIGRSGEMFFRWIVPYFMGRIAFVDADARRALLPVLCTCAITLGFMTAVEARLRPYWFSRTMERLNLAKTPNEQVFNRFGLMRAQTTLGHPIDLGVCGTIVGGMIILLTPIAGRRWNDKLPLAGVMGSGVMVAGAISFTGFMAMAAAFGLLAAFSRPRVGPRLVVPAVVMLGVGIASVMTYMLTTPISEERPADKLEESAWIRFKIVQEGWKDVQAAGFLGGGQYLDVRDVGTGSIDNAYMLFIMQFGWLYLACWIALALVLAWVGGRTLAMANTWSERLPVAAVCALLLATMLAMYTVFYGFAYALLFLINVGFLGSMYQVFRTRNMPVRGFEAAQAGGAPMARYAPQGTLPGAYR